MSSTHYCHTFTQCQDLDVRMMERLWQCAFRHTTKTIAINKAIASPPPVQWQTQSHKTKMRPFEFQTETGSMCHCRIHRTTLSENEKYKLQQQYHQKFGRNYRPALLQSEKLVGCWNGYNESPSKNALTFFLLFKSNWLNKVSIRVSLPISFSLAIKEVFKQFK